MIYYVWIAITVLLAFLAWFVWGGREAVKKRYPGFFAAIEPAEIFLYKKSVTILWARFKIVLGIMLTVLTQLHAIDITPLMPLVAEQYQLYVQVGFNSIPMILTVFGAIDEKARRDTGTPLDIVALPEATIAASPALQDIVTAAEKIKEAAPAAKAEAIVIEAKINGTT